MRSIRVSALIATLFFLVAMMFWTCAAVAQRTMSGLDGVFALAGALVAGVLVSGALHLGDDDEVPSILSMVPTPREERHRLSMPVFVSGQRA